MWQVSDAEEEGEEEDAGAAMTQCSCGEADGLATDAVMNLIGVLDKCCLTAAC